MNYKINRRLSQLSVNWLDQHSYKYAKSSDAFIFYRCCGYHTTKRLKKEKSTTLSIMEEVNSHVQFMDDILKSEFEKLRIGKYKSRISDYTLRLKTYDEVDYILCPSEFVKKSFLKKGFDPCKIIKINFGFPQIAISEETHLKKKNSFRILFVGQINFRKGLRYAIEAFKLLKHPQKEFIIVGPQTPQTGLDGIRIPKEVIFKGELKGDQLKHEYQNADIFILPSVEEGLALVQFEALSFGLPLIITENTGGADIIKNGKEGFIVTTSDSVALAEKLQILADEKNLLEIMSINAKNTAKTLWSWDDAVKALQKEISDRLI